MIATGPWGMTFSPLDLTPPIHVLPHANERTFPSSTKMEATLQ